MLKSTHPGPLQTVRSPHFRLPFFFPLRLLCLFAAKRSVSTRVHQRGARASRQKPFSPFQIRVHPCDLPKNCCTPLFWERTRPGCCFPRPRGKPARNETSQASVSTRSHHDRASETFLSVSIRGKKNPTFPASEWAIKRNRETPKPHPKTAKAAKCFGENSIPWRPLRPLREAVAFCFLPPQQNFI